MRRLVLALVVLTAASPAAAQYRRPTYIEPPRSMAAIEFIQEAGIERWEVKLSGGPLSSNKAYLRISGPSCTHMGEIRKGMITPLYDNMTFRTSSGRECKVLAIER
jgi:hypothetical protein